LSALDVELDKKNRVLLVDIASYLKEEKERVDNRLGEIIASWRDGDGGMPELCRAMAYSLTAGGKRLRPILAVSCFRACSGEGDAVYGAGSALELIHTYSLIHDDLPVMDDDDFRRGLPTCHRKFGERRAVFAGLGLLLKAFEVLDKSAASLGLDKSRRAETAASVAAAVGGGGVIGGQVVDLESENRKIDEKTLEYIHSHKTGALITVSCTLGARLAGAGGEVLEALNVYGKKIGLAFQIVDDLLDEQGDFKEMGKGVGMDKARGKATFPALYGIEESRRLAARAVGEAKEVLAGSLLAKDPVLPAIAEFIISRRT
jgi:geranylgeranyl diphosphate synthase, type II